MPPYLPVASITRSQQVRLGRGPGLAKVRELNPTDSPIGYQSGALLGPFYADLGQGNVRRDLEHHLAIGAVLPLGVPSKTVYTDLFAPSGLAVTAGSGYALNVAAGVIQSRWSGAQINVPATTVTPGAPPAYGTRTDLVLVSATGAVSVVAGAPDTLGAPTYEVDTVATTGTPTGGTFQLGFNYNGFWFVTGNIAYNAAASAVATAVLAATGGPNNVALSSFAPGAALTGSGGALTTAPVTLTAGGGLEGPITNVQVVANALTGGTTPGVTFTRVTQGAGGQSQTPGGSALVLAAVNIPATATSSSNYTITTGQLLTS